MAEPAVFAPAAIDDAALDAYVRRSVIRAVVTVVGLFVGAGVLGTAYEAELLAVTRTVLDGIGLGGLLVVLFVSDAVISPIPPDAVLLLIANSEWHQHWMLLMPALGLLSAFAGNVGWLLGRSVRGVPSVRRTLNRLQRRSEAFVRRYGKWAVAIGALTPIPFSLTCWTAGILNMRFSEFWFVTLLRVPRFVVYYVAIAFAGDVVERLF